MMDDVFQRNYTIYMFSRIVMLEPEWKEQIKRLPEIWRECGKFITKDTFIYSFLKHCEAYDLPGKTYDFEKAFKKVNTEWCVELMLSLADRIIKHYDDNAPILIKVVAWDINKKCIVVNHTLCKSFYD